MPLFTYRSGFNLITICFSALFAFFCFIYILFWGFFRFDFLIIPYLLFAIFCLISYLVTRYSFENIKTIILVYGIAFFIYESILNFKCFRIYVYSLFASTFLLGIAIFILNFNEIISLSPDRIGSAFGNLNSIGFIFAIAAFLSLFLLVTYKQHILILLLCFIFECIFAFLSGSRGAILICCVSMVCCLFVLFRGKAKKWFALSFIVLIACVLAVLQLPAFSDLKSRIMGAIISLMSGGVSGDGSSNARIAMMLEGFSLFLQSPIFGNGLGSFAKISNQLVYSHANISEMLCNFGLVGSFLWISPFFLGVKTEFVKRDGCYLVTLFSATVLLVGSFAFILYLDKFFVIYSTVYFGLIGRGSDLSYINLSIFNKDKLRIKINANSFILFRKF